MWYELTNTTKKHCGETVYQIKYKDGKLGCFVGRNVKLPTVKCETDEKTIIFGNCTLMGKIKLKNSIVGPNVHLLVEKSATVTDSTISDTYIYSVRTKIANSTISFVNCKGITSEPTGVVQFTNGCNIQGCGDKYYEKVTNIFLHKKSNIYMENINAKAFKRNININARSEKTDIHLTNVEICANKDNVDITLGGETNLTISDSTIKGSIKIDEQSSAEIKKSKITGQLQCYSTKIEDSKIAGQVFVRGAVSMEKTNINKNSLIYCMNKDKTTNMDLFKVTLFGHSEICLHEDYAESNNFISLTYIVMRDNAIIKIKNRSNFCNCSFSGNSFATGTQIECSKFFDEAMVFVGRCSDCEFSLSARVGCNKDGEEIKNSNLISLTGRRIKSRFGSISVNDENGNVIVTSENGNAVYVFSAPSVVQYISDINMEISKCLHGEYFDKKLLVGTVQKSIAYTVEETKKHYATEKKTYSDVFDGLQSLVEFIVFSILRKSEEGKTLTVEEEKTLTALMNSQMIDIARKKAVKGDPVFIKHKYLPYVPN